MRPAARVRARRIAVDQQGGGGSQPLQHGPGCCCRTVTPSRPRDQLLWLGLGGVTGVTVAPGTAAKGWPAGNLAGGPTRLTVGVSSGGRTGLTAGVVEPAGQQAPG